MKISNEVKINFKMNPNNEIPFYLYTEGLIAFENKLNSITDRRFSEALASTRLAKATGNLSFVKYPPAWAIEHLKEKVNKETVEIDFMSEDGIAISHLVRLNTIINDWQQDPLFDIVRSAICNEFHHTITILLAAKYFRQHGNFVEITNTPSAQGKSSDLFVNFGPNDTFSIEVKAPDLLFFPRPFPSRDALEKHVIKQIKLARNQITGKSGGVVVVGACHFPQHRNVFEEVIKSVTNSEKVSTRIAAVSGVFHSFSPYMHSPQFPFKQGNESFVCAFKNPSFPGKNPVNT